MTIVTTHTSRFHGALYADQGDEGVIVDAYANLVACTKDDTANVFTLAIKNSEAVIIRRDHAQRGLFEEVFRFDQKTYGKCGAGDLVCINHFLVVSLSVRVDDKQVVKSFLLDGCGVNV